MNFSPPPYLDPNSGSLLIQMLIAALLGGGIFIRSQWERIKKWFGGNTKNDESDDETDE
jgi:hypothetical protein